MHQETSSPFEGSLFSDVEVPVADSDLELTGGGEFVLLAQCRLLVLLRFLLFLPNIRRGPPPEPPLALSSVITSLFVILGSCYFSLARGVLYISLGGEVRHGPSYPDPV